MTLCDAFPIVRTATGVHWPVQSPVTLGYTSDTAYTLKQKTSAYMFVIPEKFAFSQRVLAGFVDDDPQDPAQLPRCHRALYLRVGKDPATFEVQRLTKC